MKNKKFSGPWRLEEEKPWLTKGSVEFIINNIKEDHIVLEFGSGASTIFFSKRCKKVISFESGGYSVRKNNLNRSLTWYELLIKKIHNKNIKNIELYLLQGYPQSSLLYEVIINSFSDNFFNWVLIDGTNRKLCIEKSIKKIIPGGYMIIDNYEHIPEKKHITDMNLFMQNEYCPPTMKALLRKWKCFTFDEEEWPGKGTIIFQKPINDEK